MKKYLSFIVLIFFISCVGPFISFLPDNARDAKEQNLLINTYKPSRNEVIINNTKYNISDCFTTFKPISKRNKNINEKFFAFIFKLKNAKTGEEFERQIENPFL